MYLGLILSLFLLLSFFLGILSIYLGMKLGRADEVSATKVVVTYFIVFFSKLLLSALAIVIFSEKTIIVPALVLIGSLMLIPFLIHAYLRINILKALAVFVVFLILTGIFSAGIRQYFLQAYKIPSGAMIPTVLIGDHILVNKFIYGIKMPISGARILASKKPERGEIVVFKYPEDKRRDFIKRIIAVEGDIIEAKDKMIFVNGKEVQETYTQFTDSSIRRRDSDKRDNFGPFEVSKGKYFMMGDNRDQSYDSRFWGFVDVDDIKGKALVKYFSWDSNERVIRYDRIGKDIE